MTAPRAAGTGSSVVVDRCQVCDNPDLQSALFIGYLPPVNQMRPIGHRPHEQPAYPAEFLYCPRCELVQIGLIVDPAVLFPPEYPYTSGTTKILRDNFAELYTDCRRVLPLTPADIVVDIGSNDGTLLSNFKNGGHRVRGIEPTLMANLANERGIPTTMSFFGPQAAERARGGWPGDDRDGDERVRPHRARARDRRQHPDHAEAGRRVHLGIALPDEPARDCAVLHDLPRAPAVSGRRFSQSQTLPVG